METASGSAIVLSPAVVAINKANQAKCRACLSVNRKTVRLDAKIPDLQKPSTYGQGLRQCTNLEVNVSVTASGYKWPMQICVRCCRALEVAMHFVEMAVDSNRKLYAESQRIKPPPSSSLTGAEMIVGELKRKASDELLHWNQFSQEFEQFVESYDGVPGPIEENVLYMRGAKMPRLDSDVMGSSKPPKEDDIILFDVKYDTNNQDAEDENDGSDAKNNETFFENSIINDNGEVEAATGIIRRANSSENNNNNNYKFNNKNGDMSSLPDVECDLIERAIYMTLNDDPNDQTEEKKTKDPMTSESSSVTTQINNSSSLTAATRTIAASTQLPATLAVRTPLHIPLLSCNICKYTHNEAKQLRTHYMTVHNFDMHEDDIIGLTKNQSFKCRPCNSYETKNRADMQKHLIDHHKIDGDFEMYCYVQQNCPACARIFKDQRSARTHYTRMHTQTQNEISEQIPQQTHKCTACDKIFNQKASLQAHQRFCQVKEPVQCNFCAEQFTSMRKYEVHLQQQHSVDTLHECEICHKNFKSAEFLAVHRKRHSERHYQCDKCSLNYINAAELRVHYERTHVQHEKQVSCQHCDSKFQNFALLREHEQRNHQKQKVWRCENCSFETTTRSRLRQHQYEHMNYPYKCMQCSEEFTDRGKIRQHSKKMHGIELTDDQLAEMFRERNGYTNRHDAFNKANNSLEIPGFSEDCFNELKDLGVDYDDITNDLFSNSTALDNLLDLIP